MVKPVSFFLIIFLVISYSNQSCTKGKNFCILCELATDLCKQCESYIFKPDTKGGCEGAKKCSRNDNYCLECSNSSYTCQKCEEGFYPDDNGGCSKVENCEISENGICKKCLGNFALVYKGKYYQECVSMDTEELLNCKEYDNYGHCLICKENYYLNVGDRKCSNTKNCLYSTNGTCNICDYDFYLDKSNITNYLCISNKENDPFWKCAYSEDNKTCNECLFPYFFSKNKICVKSPFCDVGNLGFGVCTSCSGDLFLSEDKFSCTISDVCKSGYEHNDKCKLCQNDYYNNLIDGNCYSNQEDNDQKYCLSVSDKCVSCIDNYYLGEDKRCSSTMNCAESLYGDCKNCIEGYFLGKLDNKCTSIEHCSKSNFNYQCEECDDHFFLYQGNCYNDSIKGDTYKNCKIVYSGINHCSECKNGFYIDYTDYLCHDNKNIEKDFYKCSNVIKNSKGIKVCNGCESPYYLTEKDLKCVTIPGCSEAYASSEICKECISGLCYNIKNQTCQQNSYIDEEEDNEVCYRCVRTIEDGTKCDKCDEGYKYSSGFCIDDSLCYKKELEECVECKQNVETEEGIKSYCLNDRYGCMESLEGCLKCNNFYDTSTCSECFKGYYLDEYFNFCYECKEGCDSCTNYEDCGGCKEGYYPIKEASGVDTYDAECDKCSDGCKFCTNNLDCEICYSGYFLNNKNPENRMKCSKCGVFCEECFDESYCLKCIDGYHLVYSEDKVICEYKREKGNK